VTPDAGAEPGDQGRAEGSGPRRLLCYRSAQGRWVVAVMVLGSSVAGNDSTVVAVALPAIGRNLHAGFQGLQWTVTSYTLTLASLILLAGSLSDRWGPFLGGWLLEAGSWRWIFLINVPGRRGGRSQTSGRSFAADAPSPSRPG
jgi:MFS family permease